MKVKRTYMEIVSYGGFERCARLVSGNVEAIVTLDVGPRVIRLGVIGERNEFQENAADMGCTGGNVYRSYGGHRLWISPEDKVRTYYPENDPIEAYLDGDWNVFSPKVDPWGVRKELCIHPSGEGGFELQHRIHNESEGHMLLAPWAITVMAPGGICLIPQNIQKPFPEVLVPVGVVALWSYTSMADPRLTWGNSLITLAQKNDMDPTKIGVFVSQGYAAYYHEPNLFIKRFPAEAGLQYPDFGCNFETFTRHDMLECESLGPMQNLDPGETAIHDERWNLFTGVKLPEDEAELAHALHSYAEMNLLPGRA